MAHEALRKMNCYTEFHDKVCAEIAPEQIAKWLQEDMGERTEVKYDSLVRSIYRYKKDVPPHLLANGGVPTRVQTKIELLKEEVDEVEELTKLYHLQMKRILQAVGTEQEINFLTKDTRKEIEEARNLIISLAELKMKLGILTKQPENLNVRVTHEEEIKALPEHDRKQLGQVASLLLRELERGGDDLIEEAEYELIEA